MFSWKEMDADQLEREILKHKKLYYRGEPEIDDWEYDLIEDRLKELRPDSKVLEMVGAPWDSL